MAENVRYDISLLTDYDVYLFREGNHSRLYEKLGSHILTIDGVRGTLFSVWAPDAETVAVKGNFNYWNSTSHYLSPRKDHCGVWEGFIPGIDKGTLYKYHIKSRGKDYQVEKADPFAFFCEMPPKTASIVWNTEYQWNDKSWLEKRGQFSKLNHPISIYEMHIGSWMKKEDNWSFSYREIAPRLVEHIKKTGFTHVEFLPIMEHPFYPSWGYQITGYFAPTSRFGTPQDFMYLVDYLHQNDIGVILDWVPSHFPNDQHGLSYFDGTHLYEHADPKQGFHPDWKSCVFNYGRSEVRNFLFSSAIFWLKQYHADGLRVDGVASMLYLDYSRKEGEWIPNKYGGKENIDAIYFLRKFNEEVYRSEPDVQTFAEESTAWPMVSKPTYTGGLGFGFKWDMGWMHDTLKYITRNPIFRRFHHNELTFRMLYAFTENFILSLSHDEVVHGKGSLLSKMPGDDWQKFANLRLLFGYMFGQPGKKLLFMGGEFGQGREWNFEASLDWHLLSYEQHQGIEKWICDLNAIYKKEKALYEIDSHESGFEWIDCSDADSNILSFIRKGHQIQDTIIVVCNFSPVPRYNYKIGVPYTGFWKEILNSDATMYYGSGIGNLGGVDALDRPSHGRPFSVSLTIPPLGILFFKKEG